MLGCPFNKTLTHRSSFKSMYISILSERMVFRQLHAAKSIKSFSSSCVFPICFPCLGIPACTGSQNLTVAEVTHHCPCYLVEVGRVMSIIRRLSEHVYANKLNRVRPWMQGVVNECPYCLMLGCSLEWFCSAPRSPVSGIAQPWFGRLWYVSNCSQ